ncbi:MAG: type II CAAX prenyl endopeptidase Rce1 family protein [Thermosynechococcaceae cyanobacterium]
MHWRRLNGLWQFALLVAFTLGMVWIGNAQESPQVSNDAIAQQAPFNRPAYYPLKQAVDPTLYQPVSDWVGRLILPPAPQSQDWVWLEVYHAPSPYQAWTGKQIRLEWGEAAQGDVNATTRTIDFSAEAKASQKIGNVHPVRLNHRQVGPLQSLAGARPNDDVIVAVEPQIVQDGDLPILKITTDPVQVPERYYTVVKILKPVQNQGEDISPPCLEKTCSQERFEVRHYRAESQAFDGPQEVIRIPQVTADQRGVYRSTIEQLAQSPAGQDGWYLYGAKNADGMFVAKAIAPRSLFELKPTEILTGKAATYRQQKIGAKGTVHSVLVAARAKNADAVLADWEEGDQALVLHLFGGIGGDKAEPQSVIGTVSGHFAFGTAQIIRDPLTRDLRFQIEYQQVYAHNPDGIVAGPIDWGEYMGNLQRGWLGDRPVTDVLVKLPAITEDYDFDGINISPITELKHQLQLMAARYRTGDGTGAALVTPAKSCVQDSGQALYTTIKLIEEQVSRSATVQAWLRSHPNHPQNQRFQELVALGRRLESELAPLGIVRSDWQQNAEVLTGIRPQRGFANEDNVVTQILSWRTLIPQVAHHRLTTLFRASGAQLWYLNTNQVGGWDASIAPLAATQLLGRWLVIPYLFSRLIEALTTWPSIKGWLISGAIVVAYAAIALPWGWNRGFLQRPSAAKPHSRHNIVKVAAWTFFAPALVEEIGFRVLLIPHPTEFVLPRTMLLWVCISLGLFIIYHPINALTAYKQGNPTFFQPIFLSLATLLGIACTSMYLITGSLWPSVLLHWLAVVIWLLWLGGLERLRLVKSRRAL